MLICNSSTGKITMRSHCFNDAEWCSIFRQFCDDAIFRAPNASLLEKRTPLTKSWAFTLLLLNILCGRGSCERIANNAYHQFMSEVWRWHVQPLSWYMCNVADDAQQFTKIFVCSDYDQWEWLSGYHRWQKLRLETMALQFTLQAPCPRTIFNFRTPP